MFEPNVSRELTRFPEDAEHFSVRSKTGIGVGWSNLPHRGADYTFKVAPFGLPTNHKPVERFLCIEVDELSTLEERLRIGA